MKLLCAFCPHFRWPERRRCLLSSRCTIVVAFFVFCYEDFCLQKFERKFTAVRPKSNWEFICWDNNDALQHQAHWRGEVAYFSTYAMKLGTVKPSNKNTWTSPSSMTFLNKIFQKFKRKSVEIALPSSPLPAPLTFKLRGEIIPTKALFHFNLSSLQTSKYDTFESYHNLGISVAICQLLSFNRFISRQILARRHGQQPKSADLSRCSTSEHHFISWITAEIASVNISSNKWQGQKASWNYWRGFGKSHSRCRKHPTRSNAATKKREGWSASDAAEISHRERTDGLHV